MKGSQLRISPGVAEARNKDQPGPSGEVPVKVSLRQAPTLTGSKKKPKAAKKQPTKESAPAALKATAVLPGARGTAGRASATNPQPAMRQAGHQQEQPQVSAAVNVQPPFVAAANVQPPPAVAIDIQPPRAVAVNIQPPPAVAVNIQPPPAVAVNIQLPVVEQPDDDHSPSKQNWTEKRHSSLYIIESKMQSNHENTDTWD